MARPLQHPRRRPGASAGPSAVSLFSGAGGLDLGLEAAGFSVRLCVEIDSAARATLSRNRPSWPLAEPGDIHLLSPSDLLDQAGVTPRDIDLLAGGPPCQPFSKSGYWSSGDSQRLADPRSATLKAYLRVVAALLPRVLLLENVRGIAYEGKDEGIKLVLRGLRAINRKYDTNYRPHVFCVNAADYGVPQLRERVFLIASRDGERFTPPHPTHGSGPELQPYVTAWDAIGDLDNSTPDPSLSLRGKWSDLIPSIPEGLNYLWHTQREGGVPLFGWRCRYWSFLLKLAKDLPSWTLQAAPGPATGPFHWRNRRLSIRELARLQTFPDQHSFDPSYAVSQRLIGNAVPCLIGEVLGRAIRRQLLHQTIRDEILQFLPESQGTPPPPERRKPVPQKYLSLQSTYAAHPGAGLGPAAIRWSESRPVIPVAVPT